MPQASRAIKRPYSSSLNSKGFVKKENILVEKEKAASEKSHLPPSVGMRRLERPTPTSRT